MNIKFTSVIEIIVIFENKIYIMDMLSNYDLILNPNLKGLNLTFDSIESEINKLNKQLFKYKVVGFSENNLPIYRIEIGKGKLKILLWTQMHGDESTATKSIFDLFNIVNYYKFTDVINSILENCTLYFIPMLNPDGSNLFTRENIYGLDINRDAKTLLNAESRLLLSEIELLKPDFAFNLHDQTGFYNVKGTDKIASISLLAPAADKEKTLTPTRQKAMSVIVTMNKLLQKIEPGSVGRYNDTFCDSCFGDTIQSMNIPTILIESGYFQTDFEREYTRKIHTIILLEALKSIADNEFPDFNLYFNIPSNDKLYYDFKIVNTIYNSKISEIGIRLKKVLKDNILVNIIDPSETIIIDNELKDKYFHNTVNAEGMELNRFIVDKLLI